MKEISAKLSKEGGINQFQIIGKGFVAIQDPAMANCQILVEMEKYKGCRQKPHPNLDRNAWKKQ